MKKSPVHIRSMTSIPASCPLTVLAGIVLAALSTPFAAQDDPLKTAIRRIARQLSGPRATAISCVIGSFAFGNLFTPALARDYNYYELPALSPDVGLNGVNPTSGTFTAASPLHLAPPGAEHLDLNVIHVKVHLVGHDKLFNTRGRSPC